MSRPFEPGWCARAVDLGREGRSRAEILSALDLSSAEATVFLAEQPEFAAALARAEDEARAWWEGMPLRALETGGEFRAALWGKVMSQRFGRTGHRAGSDTEGDDGDVPPRPRARFEIPDNGRDRKLRRAGPPDEG